MRYAVDFWEVDIISVSFGFQEGVSMLHDAVNYCAKKTIIFVAASCDPDPESKNWFAQHPDVIPVFATDENGDPYARNPAPKKDQNNFAFPGYWRAKPSISSLDPGVIAISSGTCCAAPLAAGVGALLLAQLPGAVEQGLSNLDESLDLKQFRKSLRTASGMKAAFTAMSKERRGYDCVQPWLAFEDENVLQRIVQHLLSTGTF
jgi:subtilisin family serine protease